MAYEKAMKYVTDMLSDLPPAPLPKPPKAGDLIQETEDGWLFWTWGAKGDGSLVQVYVPRKV